MTPLMWAAFHGKANNIETLRKRGAGEINIIVFSFEQLVRIKLFRNSTLIKTSCVARG